MRQIRLHNFTFRNYWASRKGASIGKTSTGYFAGIDDVEAALGGKQRTAPRGRISVTAPVRFGEMHVAPVVDAFLRQSNSSQIGLRAPVFRKRLGARRSMNTPPALAGGFGLRLKAGLVGHSADCPLPTRGEGLRLSNRLRLDGLGWGKRRHCLSFTPIPTYPLKRGKGLISVPAKAEGVTYPQFETLNRPDIQRALPSIDSEREE